jgi:hypothetical protein
MPKKLRNLIKTNILCFLILLSKESIAHPMPNTLVNLSVQKTQIEMILKIPLSDFYIAFGEHNNGFIEMTEDKLQAYFQKHIKIQSADSTYWQQQFNHYEVLETQDSIVGKYEELLVKLILTPSVLNNLRAFTLIYDAIIHQIPNHEALVFLRHDMDIAKPNENKQIGIIKLDIPTGKILPLSILLEKKEKPYLLDFNMDKIVNLKSWLIGSIITIGLIIYFKKVKIGIK